MLPPSAPVTFPSPVHACGQPVFSAVDATGQSSIVTPSRQDAVRNTQLE